MRGQGVEVLIGKPDDPINLGRPLRQVEAHDVPSFARLGFAYVSNSGLEVLLSVLSGIPNWDAIQKEWIIGLQRAITEPLAIQRIRTLPNCRARVFVGAERLSAASLLSGQLFHAKLICLASNADLSAHPLCLVASSANLTGAALSVRARNYEFGISLQEESLSGEQYRRFQDWWLDAWNSSSEITDELLNAYSRLRNEVLKRNPDMLASLDPPSTHSLNNSGTLWIEAGAMSGGSRNQVEFNEQLAGFSDLYNIEDACSGFAQTTRNGAIDRSVINRRLLVSISGG